MGPPRCLPMPPTAVLPHRAGALGPPPHPVPLARAVASPGEVDALLGELAGAVDRVLVGLVLHHLHALALLALLVTVFADGVELPHAVLQSQRLASALPPPAPGILPAEPAAGAVLGWAPLYRANGFPTTPLRGETEAWRKGVTDPEPCSRQGSPGTPCFNPPASGLLQCPGEGQILPSLLFLGGRVSCRVPGGFLLSKQPGSQGKLYIYLEREGEMYMEIYMCVCVHLMMQPHRKCFIVLLKIPSITLTASAILSPLSA